MEPENSQRPSFERGRLSPIATSPSRVLPSPAELTPSSTSPTEPDSPSSQASTYRHSSPKPLPRHSRSGSSADAAPARPSKRLSVHFPIQPSPAVLGRPSLSVSPSLVGTPLASPELDPSPTASTFLTALAAQERRVLELREELRAAEHGLERLKKQWASHEAMRKRNDTRRVHPLQPLSTALGSQDASEEDVDGSALWLQKEIERRKALLNGVRPSQRTVFSGSRHTRTLSLLSPDKEKHRPSFPQPADTQDMPDPTKMKSPSRSTTVPETPGNRMDMDGANELDMTPRDALLRTGKQMASDFKEGLWTFIEDLRQATVGDEGINGSRPRSIHAFSAQKPTRRHSSKGNFGNRVNNSHSRKLSIDKSANDQSHGQGIALADIERSFWKDHGLAESAAPTPVKSAKPNKNLKTPSRQALSPMSHDVDDSWDTWDTPHRNSPARSNSNTSISPSTAPSEVPSSLASGPSSARTSTRYHPSTLLQSHHLTHPAPTHPAPPPPSPPT